MQKTKTFDMTSLNEGGYVETTVEELTGLNSEQVYLIDLHIALTKSVRERRVNMGLSQANLARKMGSSQSRVATMESYGPNVSLDLLIRALLALAIKPTELGEIIANVPAPIEFVAKMNYSQINLRRVAESAALKPQTGRNRTRSKLQVFDLNPK